MQENKLHFASLQSLTYLSEIGFPGQSTQRLQLQPSPDRDAGAQEPLLRIYSRRVQNPAEPHGKRRAAVRVLRRRLRQERPRAGVRPLHLRAAILPFRLRPFTSRTRTTLSRGSSIAWAPEIFHGKTAIRAGSGISYSDGQFGGLYFALHPNRPVLQPLASEHSESVLPGHSVFLATPPIASAIRARTAIAKTWP